MKLEFEEFADMATDGGQTEGKCKCQSPPEEVEVLSLATPPFLSI